jgi:vancomycin permeability regulator SanA
MRGRWWLGVAVGLGALVVTPPTVWVRVRSARRIVSVANAPRTDFAVVLGAGVRWDGRPTPVLRGRLRIAHALYESGKVHRILLSGSPESRGHSEPVAMRAFLLEQGVPAEAIELDESGVDTWHSCVAAATRFGLRRAIVVTSGFHLPRAVALCRRAGIDAYGVGHDSLADGLRRVSARGRRREVLATIKAFWWRRSNGSSDHGGSASVGGSVGGMTIVTRLSHDHGVHGETRVR